MAEHERYRRRDTARELKALAATAVALLLILAGVWWLTQRRPAAGLEGRQDPRPGDPVVIEVNGEPIRLSELGAALDSLPPQMRERYSNEIGRKEVAEELVRMKVLEQQARRMGLGEDPDVRGRLEMLEANALASAALQRLVKNAGPAKVEELYEKSRDRFETAQVKSILLPYQGSRATPRSGQPLSAEAAQSRARRLVTRIRKGESFDAIARAESADGRGGEPSEVARGNLPRVLEEVIFSLPIGQISDPVRTSFGIHIFQVTERKTAPLEQVRAILQQESDTFTANAIIEELRKQAKVEFKKPYFKG